MKLKSLFRRAKDVIFPWRKNRREHLANLGKEIANLYHSIAKVEEQSQARFAQLQEFNKIVQSNDSFLNDLKTWHANFEQKLADNQTQLSARLDVLQLTTDNIVQQIQNSIMQLEQFNALDQRQTQLFDQVVSLTTLVISQRELALGQEKSFRDFQRDFRQQFADLCQHVEDQAETPRFTLDPAVAEVTCEF